MDWSKPTKLEYWTAGLALALAIDLLALPWVEVSIGPYSYSDSGIGSPDGFLGVLALLVALAVGADVLLGRMVPSFRIGALEAFGRGRARFFAATGAGVLVVLKLLLHLHPSYLGAGCWIALVFAAALIVSTARLRAQPETLAPQATGRASTNPRVPDTNA